MRDIVILVLVILIAMYSLRRPWIGAVAGVLISLMSPHVEFGFSAATWPVAQLVAVTTLIGMLATPERQNPFIGAPVAWFVAFWIWICITLPFSFYFDDSQPLWLRSMKIFLLVLIALVLITDKNKLDALIWAIVVALGFYGVKGGVFTLLTGGNHRVWGPGGFVEGNNELALALVSTVPLVVYLRSQATNRWVRMGLLGTMLILPLTILGSHSRGALLALAAMGFVLWIRSDRKVLWASILVAMVPLLLSFMPEHWWSRMETIQTYESDGSAMGRINAWWMAWHLARENLFGGGFSIYTAQVFAKYAPDPLDVHAAHSIYFQVLGEHGLVGLILFLGIGAQTLWTGQRLIRMGKQREDLRWAGMLGGMLQVSIIGFGVGGTFLSLAYFDLLYYQMAIAVLGAKFASAQLEGAGQHDSMSRPVARSPETGRSGAALGEKA